MHKDNVAQSCLRTADSTKIQFRKKYRITNVHMYMTLDSLYIITKFILPWVPYRGAVFKLRADISVVSCFFNFLIICLYISFNKFQRVVCFRGHIFNVGTPIKVITNCDSKVFSICNFCMVIEDEIHALCQCKKYSLLREQMYQTVFKTTVNSAVGKNGHRIFH